MHDFYSLDCLMAMAYIFYQSVGLRNRTLG